MSSKPFQRKDLKHDQFVQGAGRATNWLMERRRRIGWALLAVAVVLSVIFSVRFAHQRQEQQAAALLAAAMEVYRAPIVPPTEDVATPVSDAPDAAGEPGAADGEEADTEEGPESATPPTGLQFASLEQKNSAAIERFEPIVERYGGRPSGRLAAYYLGICQSELGNADAAIEALQQAAEASAPLISAMALYRLGQLELGRGNASAAVDYFDRLMESGDGLFPPEEALMSKARAHEDADDPRAALAAYQRVLNEYAGTYAAVEARARAEELSAKLGVEMQGPGASD